MAAEGAAVLGMALPHNKTLTELHVEGNDMGVAGHTALAQAMGRNTGIKLLSGLNGRIPTNGDRAGGAEAFFQSSEGIRASLVGNHLYFEANWTRVKNFVLMYPLILQQRAAGEPAW